MGKEIVPILIVGAGTTGLTLACVLRRADVPVRIIDKLPNAMPFARACNVRSRSLEVFQDLGFVEAIIESGHKIYGENQFANGEHFTRSSSSEMESPYPFSIGIEQWKTEGLLERRLADLGTTIERETELLAITERLDGVRATLRHRDESIETVDVPWLVGCDGAHSTVRHINRQHFPGDIDPSHYIIADVVLDGTELDEIRIFITDDGLLGMLPLPGGRTLMSGDVTAAPDGHSEAPALGDLQAVLDVRGPSGAKARDPRWLSWYRIHYRVTPHYRHGRTFLAGDAAHVQSPFTGQGMNTGIQDAYNLGWKLAVVYQGRAPESLLDSYEKERHSVAKDVVELSKAVTRRLGAFAQCRRRTVTVSTGICACPRRKFVGNRATCMGSTWTIGAVRFALNAGDIERRRRDPAEGLHAGDGGRRCGPGSGERAHAVPVRAYLRSPPHAALLR